MVLDLGWLKGTRNTERDTIHKQGLEYCYLGTHNHRQRMWYRREFSHVTYKAVWLRTPEKQRQTEMGARFTLQRHTFHQALQLLQTHSVWTKQYIKSAITLIPSATNPCRVTGFTNWVNPFTYTLGDTLCTDPDRQQADLHGTKSESLLGFLSIPPALFSLSSILWSVLEEFWIVLTMLCNSFDLVH